MTFSDETAEEEEKERRGQGTTTKNEILSGRIARHHSVLYFFCRVIWTYLIFTISLIVIIIIIITIIPLRRVYHGLHWRNITCTWLAYFRISRCFFNYLPDSARHSEWDRTGKRDREGIREVGKEKLPRMKTNPVQLGFRCKWFLSSVPIFLSILTSLLLLEIAFRKYF